jgi:hypothetical protein
VERSQGGGLVPEYATMRLSLGHIYRTAGIGGLWRGSLARVLFTAPNTAITMVVFEKTRSSVGPWFRGTTG